MSDAPDHETAAPDSAAVAHPLSSRMYNTGSDSDRRKALDSVYDYNKTLITVATGTVALTATFLKDLYQGQSLLVLTASWVTLGVSVFAGMIGMGGYVSQYAESDIRPRRGLPEWASLIQLLCVVAGLALLGIFAVNNATADGAESSISTSVTTTAPSKPPATSTWPTPTH